MKIWFHEGAIKKATGVPLNSTSQPAFTCSKLTIETLEHHWPRSGIFIVNFEHILHLVRVWIVNFEHVIAWWANNKTITNWWSG